MQGDMLKLADQFIEQTDKLAAHGYLEEAQNAKDCPADPASRVTTAVLSAVAGYSGDFNLEDGDYNSLNRVVTEIIQKGMAVPANQALYEQAGDFPARLAYTPVKVPPPVGDLVELEKFWRGAALGVPGSVDLFVKVRDGEMSAEEAIQQSFICASTAHDLQVAAEVDVHFKTAERWANKPGLTVREACHGVANDTYGLRYHPDYPPLTPKPGFNPDAVYSNAYTTKLSDEIAARTVRSAKELFGY